jgi:hypothetical protein
MAGFLVKKSSGLWYRFVLRIGGGCLLLFFGLALGVAVFAQAEPGEGGDAPASADPVAGAATEGGLPSESGDTAADEAAGKAPSAEPSAKPSAKPVAEPASELAAETAGEEAPAALESGPSGFEIIPEEVRRPRRGEAPRYPRDMVIGTLGRGGAPEEAYALARTCLEALLTQDQDSEHPAIEDAARREEIFSGLKPVAPQKFRIGGGREEPDGGVSFLFRFIGREQGVAGELYLRPGEEGEEEQEQEQGWVFDDIILEEPQALAVVKDPYRYDFSPYERFF